MHINTQHGLHYSRDGTVAEVLSELHTDMYFWNISDFVGILPPYFTPRHTSYTFIKRVQISGATQYLSLYSYIILFLPRKVERARGGGEDYPDTNEDSVSLW